VAGAAGVLVQDEALPEVEERLSWRLGFVVFHETRLSDAVAELNRYNERQIVIDDPTLGSMRIGGHFRSNNAEGFVRLIAEALPIRVEEQNSRIVLRHQ
jgi:transmembrane sensor